MLFVITTYANVASVKLTAKLLQRLREALNVSNAEIVTVSIENVQVNTQSFADISYAFSVTVSLLWFTLKSIAKQAVHLYLPL